MHSYLEVKLMENTNVKVSLVSRVSDLLKKGYDFIVAQYQREEVQKAVKAVVDQAKAVYSWIRTQIERQPEAAAAGAAAATVTIIAVSVITVGLVISVVAFAALTAGAHYHFTHSKKEETVAEVVETAEIVD